MGHDATLTLPSQGRTDWLLWSDGAQSWLRSRRYGDQGHIQLKPSHLYLEWDQIMVCGVKWCLWSAVVVVVVEACPLGCLWESVVI